MIKFRKRTLVIMALLFSCALAGLQAGCAQSGAPTTVSPAHNAVTQAPAVGMPEGTQLPPTPTVQDVQPVLTQETVVFVEATSTAAAPPDVEEQILSSLPELAGEPAGCLSMAEQAQLETVDEMLAYADRLLGPVPSLADRRMASNWNPYTEQYSIQGVLTITAANLQPEYIVQKMLNALHVAGFAAWLRKSPEQGLHILAVPLLSSTDVPSEWSPYVEAYWQGRHTIPEGDETIIPALKLPPCTWMVEAGYAPTVAFDWWADVDGSWPDYASAAQAFLAPDTETAFEVARSLSLEGPDTMCGPLVLGIYRDAGAFPPDFGSWSLSPKAFWLAKPRTNGRPWSLIPPEMGRVYVYKQPLFEFDFHEWPLYPGDFLFTYSFAFGFDHMSLVTEVEDGRAYSVTNLVRRKPVVITTVERVLLLDLADPSAGIIRNQWRTDLKNGRTGDNGFEVFRWAWVEKDLNNEPVEYVVQPGDTPGLIAERWRTPVNWIASYNGIAPSAALSIGETLVIPPNQSEMR